MIAIGSVWQDDLNCEIFVGCQACQQGSIYSGQPDVDPVKHQGDITRGRYIAELPVMTFPRDVPLSQIIPARVRDLFKQGSRARSLEMFDAAGAVFRKTIDVATQVIYDIDGRLIDKQPANAARVRIQALGQFGIIDDELLELADVALVDGNDAVHDKDPYTASETEALEALILDLLERLFVRPARVAAVKAKQIAAGQRKPEV
jgi:hypothetical protein